MNSDPGGALKAPPGDHRVLQAPDKLHEHNSNTPLNEGDISQSQNISQNLEQSENVVRHSFKYDNNALGPYTVTVQGDKGKNVGNLHPMSMAKVIFNLNLSNIKKPMRKGKNKVIIEFRTPEAANQFVDIVRCRLIRRVVLYESIQFDQWL